jgi:hypothetical protein
MVSIKYVVSLFRLERKNAMNEVFVPEVCMFPAQIELVNTHKRSLEFSALFFLCAIYWFRLDSIYIQGIS